MKMSRNYFPTPEEMARALVRLDQARLAFERSMDEQSSDQSPAGAMTETLAAASRAYRLALLDPHLPPPA